MVEVVELSSGYGQVNPAHIPVVIVFQEQPNRIFGHSAPKNQKHTNIVKLLPDKYVKQKDGVQWFLFQKDVADFRREATFLPNEFPAFFRFLLSQSHLYFASRIQWAPPFLRIS